MNITEPRALLEQGLQLFNRGLYAEAEKRLMAMPASAPHFPEALQAAAIAISYLDRNAEALCLLETAAYLAPENPAIQYSLGVTNGELDRPQHAMLAYQACLRLDPNHIDALWNYGELLRTRLHFSAALELLERMRPNLPQHREAAYYHRLGVTLGALHHFDAAREAFERSIALNDDDVVVTYWEFAHLLLSIGDWRNGWLAYDYRFAAGYKTNVACHDFPYPLWRGEDLRGKTLLIHGEQGLGDEIMFGQIVPEIQYPDLEIIWACQPPLVRLFSNSNPAIEVVSHQVVRFPMNFGNRKIDYQIPVGSLGRWFRKTDDDFRRHQHYLKPMAGDVASFAQRLQILQGGKGKSEASNARLKVGIMWGANPSKDVKWGRERSLRKSILIEKLIPLAKYCDDIQFVSLQNRDAGQEAALAPELGLLDLHVHLQDMADTAALMKNMDLVISVDTSIAHLAGSMGMPVWILLMEQADWRWQHHDDKSIWYSSARLFRQRTQGRWDEVVDELDQALGQWIQDQRRQSS